uniref:Geranylgeranyl transferase putative n=1 Tax=Albugo laibachii Nc14 TaxID=890382 RepID=F0WE87_9STRA|nr:geranylgeranyl transferase putative [Albugo laibachii Nc14]|eukprot:CCA19516.1 geranylgeranyl transferase putative [Albugo laibachii Nc14]
MGPDSLDKELHALYFLRNLKSLSEGYELQDSNRVVLAFFCIHGLAILNELHRVDKDVIIEWVYELQVQSNDPDSEELGGGFRGSLWFGRSDSVGNNSALYDASNIAATYAALCILKTLGDDQSRVHKKEIVQMLGKLQHSSGCFSSMNLGSEQDMRFVFCACAISYMLDDWSGIDKALVCQYINKCRNYDGSIGIAPGTEGQGGAVFCAIAALRLSGCEEKLDCKQKNLIRWLMFRQHNGFQGRCNKEPDSCYAFWNGGALDMLEHHAFVDIESIQNFVVSCQHSFGGFCKYPDSGPDVMHSYYSLAWLSIASRSSRHLGIIGLKPMDTKLQIPFCV